MTMTPELTTLSDEQKSVLQAQQFGAFLADFLLGKSIWVVCLKRGETKLTSSMPGDFLSIRVKNGKLTWWMDVPSGYGHSVAEEFSLHRTYDEARAAHHAALKTHLEFYVDELPSISHAMLKTIENARSERLAIPSALTTAIEAKSAKEKHYKIKKAEEAVTAAQQELDKIKSQK